MCNETVRTVLARSRASASTQQVAVRVKSSGDASVMMENVVCKLVHFKILEHFSIVRSFDREWWHRVLYSPVPLTVDYFGAESSNDEYH